jgi:hypothetical protein
MAWRGALGGEQRLPRDGLLTFTAAARIETGAMKASTAVNWPAGTETGHPRGGNAGGGPAPCLVGHAAAEDAREIDAVDAVVRSTVTQCNRWRRREPASASAEVLVVGHLRRAVVAAIATAAQAAASARGARR